MTNPRPRTSHALRCFCQTQPILAMYGVDEKGQLYLHIKAYKQKRIYCEVVINAPASVKLHCRACFRWQRVNMISPARVNLTETPVPKFLAS